jgi:hypothetical protein
MPAKPTYQDLDFQPLFDRGNPELIPGCWYEHVRESCSIRAVMKEWLRLETARAEMFQRAKDQNIEQKDIRFAFLYFVQGVRWNLHGLEYTDQDLRKKIERENAAAVKLLSVLSDKYPELAFSEFAVERWESCEYHGKRAPRFRLLAKHLVNDTPWLLIPQEDRESAIASALKDNDTDAFILSRILPPVETEDDLQELIRLRKALPGMFPGEKRVCFRIRFGHYTRNEIIEGLAQWVKDHYPKKWKHRAKGSGRDRLDWVEGGPQTPCCDATHARQACQQGAIQIFGALWPRIVGLPGGKIRREVFSKIAPQKYQIVSGSL